jgi:hypothetical protein
MRLPALALGHAVPLHLCCLRHLHRGGELLERVSTSHYSERTVSWTDFQAAEHAMAHTLGRSE